MTRTNDIDRFAEQVGFPARRAFSDLSDLYPRLERFAALVADAEAKRMHAEGMVTVGHMRQQIAAQRQPLIDVQWLENAYLAGFMNSDEGHNGEYPFRYRKENPLEDRRWLEAKNSYICAAIAKATGESK